MFFCSRIFVRHEESGQIRRHSSGLRAGRSWFYSWQCNLFFFCTASRQVLWPAHPRTTPFLCCLEGSLPSNGLCLQRHYLVTVGNILACFAGLCLAPCTCHNVWYFELLWGALGNVFLLIFPALYFYFPSHLTCIWDLRFSRKTAQWGAS
jgi:hypothetical protein